MAIVVNEHITIPDWEYWFTASRSGGPGGQHVNTTSSKVTLHWSPANSSVLSDAQKARVTTRLANRIRQDGVLQLDAEEHRSQLRNRVAAEERLAALLVGALAVQKRRRPTKPTRGSVERRLKEKRVTAERKATRGKVDFDK